MKKILVIQQKMIGDVLASTVICTAVKRSYPNAEVHYLIHKGTHPVVENHPDIDRFILTESSETSLPQLLKLGQKFRKESYDAVIDAYGKWESIIPTYISAANTRISFRKWYTYLLYTKTITPAQNVAGSAIHHRLELAEALTGKFENIDFPKIFLSEIEIESASQLINAKTDRSKPLLMISVLGSGKDKSLPAAQMAESLDIIAGSGNLQMLFNFMP